MVALLGGCTSLLSSWLTSTHCDSAVYHVTFVYYYKKLIAAWIMFRQNIFLLMNEEVSMDDECTKHRTQYVCVYMCVCVLEESHS